MPSKKRPVIVWVDDERVTDVVWKAEARWTTPEAGGRRERLTLASGRVPVPSNDQLTRDIDMASWLLAALAGLVDSIPRDEGKEAPIHTPTVRALATRLRAAFDLDEGNDDDIEAHWTDRVDADIAHEGNNPDLF